MNLCISLVSHTIFSNHVLWTLLFLHSRHFQFFGKWQKSESWNCLILICFLNPAKYSDYRDMESSGEDLVTFLNLWSYSWVFCCNYVPELIDDWRSHRVTYAKQLLISKKQGLIATNSQQNSNSVYSLLFNASYDYFEWPSENTE